MSLIALIIDCVKPRREYTVQDVMRAYLNESDKSGFIDDARNTPQPQRQRTNEADQKTVKRWLKAN